MMHVLQVHVYIGIIRCGYTLTYVYNYIANHLAPKWAKGKIAGTCVAGIIIIITIFPCKVR